MLFHELGHAIHYFASETRFACWHGAAGTVDDFVEAPSKMLELWCWTEPTLRAMGRHYSYLSEKCYEVWQKKANGADRPEEHMPQAMIEGLCRAKSANGALRALNSVFKSMFDMRVHGPETHEAIANMNITAEYTQLRKDIIQLDGAEELDQGDEWGHGQASFRHIISPYSATYYGYLQ